jgi:hypothetical protein
MSTDEILPYTGNENEIAIFPDCIYCTHFIDGGTCDAFTNGIPEDIWDGTVSHQSQYPGDNGIQYEAMI